MAKVIVIGSGMVGSAMAIDLSHRHAVTATDLQPGRLERIQSRCPEISTKALDITNRDLLRETVKTFDIVICAVPGFLGFETLRTIIEAGTPVVDISFSPENTMELDALAKEKKVTAIVDCGVAPGIGNLVVGYHDARMKLNSFECLVGGLPVVKKWPFCYKAPFSPIDVIEEYTRPARFRENGVMVTREALSDCEYVEFDQAGTLESFNTDGLRSLLFTLPHIPNMKEKTLRYPGHVELIKALRESGFFSTDPITIGDKSITPLEFTGKILINDWKLQEGEEEFTVMRITLTGMTNEGEKKKIVYHLHDRYDHATATTSMARTTGYTATAAAQMILDGIFTKHGVFPPELVGKEESCYHYILGYLKERGVVMGIGS